MSKAIISFSGGMGSAVSALLAYENNIPFELVFADTLIEDEDLYRFIKDISSVVDKKINWLKDGRTPWEVFVDKKYIGNTRTAHCSDILKTQQVRNWMKNNCSEDDYLVLGMGISEIDRIERAQKNWSPIKVVSLLQKYKIIPGDYEDILKIYHINKPRLYEYGFPHNNCGGMCVRSGLKQFATLLENFPERFDHHAKEQEKAMEKIGPTARPFLREMKDGVTHYITLIEFKSKYENNEIKIDPYDFGGCACFIDEVKDV